VLSAFELTFLFVRGKNAINHAESTKFGCPGDQAFGICAPLVAKFPLCTVGLSALKK